MIPENTYRKERERQIARLLQEGDLEALAIVYDNYAPVLLGLITRIINDRDAAETVLQRAFLMVWEQRSGYDSSKTGLLTWMIMLAKEAAIEALNSGMLAKTSNTSGSKSRPENPNKADGIFCNLLHEEKAILDLIYLKGYSCKEAAAEMGMPVETLIKNLRMAIKHIQTETAS